MCDLMIEWVEKVKVSIWSDGAMVILMDSYSERTYDHFQMAWVFEDLFKFFYINIDDPWSYNLA